ncbi:MAG: hypothetical protein LC118_18405 [Dehalococcoidia bacterium]|nr:hypothetical protein [Dehalococcoidia bacterium]
MTKVFKVLGSGGLAAVLGILLLGFSGAMNAQTVSAESPPNPPGRFVGSVKVNGVPAAAGTAIEARIGTSTCGVTTVFMSGSDARYSVDVPALDPGANPNCGTDGAAVAFYVGGQKANESGSWKNYQLNQLDLTVTTATATPAVPVKTPGAPVTGSGVASDAGSSAVWLFAVLGLGALAFGVSGVAVARRSR